MPDLSNYARQMAHEQHVRQAPDAPPAAAQTPYAELPLMELQPAPPGSPGKFCDTECHDISDWLLALVWWT